MNEGLRRLVDALEPGARPVGLRRLRGGLGARMHVLRYQAPSGERRSVVLRRPRPESRQSSQEGVRHLFDVLRAVAAVGISAPQPLLLDADGTYFGGPAMVTSYIPGTALLMPRDHDGWVEGLARGAAAIHAVEPDQDALQVLRRLPRAAGHLSEFAERARTGEPIARKALSVLETRMDEIAPLAPRLVHNDYWPGNTIWFRGRMVAVIDWANAGLGDPREDIAQCRADLVFVHGLDTADAFLACYQGLAPEPVPDLWFYDLLRGLLSLLFYDRWLVGYHDAGMRHLRLEDVRQRIDAFLERALEAAGG